MILICVVSALDVTLISCVPCCFMSHEKEKEFINAKEPIMRVRHFFWCQAFKNVISTWTATYYSEFITNFQPNEWKTFLYIAQVTSNKILIYSIFLRQSSRHSHWIMLNSYFLLRHSSLGLAKPYVPVHSLTLRAKN